MQAQLTPTQIREGIQSGKRYRIELNGVRMLAHSVEWDEGEYKRELDDWWLEFQILNLEDQGIDAFGYLCMDELPALVLCEEVPQRA